MDHRPGHHTKDIKVVSSVGKTTHRKASHAIWSFSFDPQISMFMFQSMCLCQELLSQQNAFSFQNICLNWIEWSWCMCVWIRGVSWSYLKQLSWHSASSILMLSSLDQALLVSESHFPKHKLGKSSGQFCHYSQFCHFISEIFNYEDLLSLSRCNWAPFTSVQM